MKTKKYNFIFEDRNGNELKTIQLDCDSITDVRCNCKRLKSLSLLNDLHKIVIKKVLL